MSDQKTFRHEIAVIGGGPAGTTAASFLSSSGFDVCLFERKSFPRDVLCGEFLSAEVIDKIKELDLYSNFQSLNPNPIRSFKFIDKKGKSISAGFDFQAFALRRSEFDKMLLDKCYRSGVAIYQPAEVLSVNRLNNTFNIEARTELGVISIETKFVIASYGKQNKLDNFFFRNFINNKSRLNGIKLHLSQKSFRNFNNDEIIIFTGSNIYCGLNKINEAKVTICFLENRSDQDEPARAKLIRNIKSNPVLIEMFTNNLAQEVESEQVYGTGNIYFGKKEKFRHGIFFIGDAAGLTAPLAGDGIAMAMESGKLISEIILKTKTQAFSFDRMAEVYEKRWNELFSKRIRSSLIIQKILMNTFLTSAGLGIASAYPDLLKQLIKITRNYSPIPEST